MNLSSQLADLDRLEQENLQMHFRLKCLEIASRHILEDEEAIPTAQRFYDWISTGSVGVE